MRNPIEVPDAPDGDGTPQLIVGGLWGTTQPDPPGQEWVEWHAEADDGDDGMGSVVLGRD